MEADRKKRVRAILGEVFGWECHYCGIPLCEDMHVRPLPPGMDYPTIDHKLPTSKGGDNDIQNLVLACNKCNATKRELISYEDFKARFCRPEEATIVG